MSLILVCNLELQHALFTSKVLWAKERAPTPFPSVVFSLRLVLESFKKFAGSSQTCIFSFLIIALSVNSYFRLHCVPLFTFRNSLCFQTFDPLQGYGFGHCCYVGFHFQRIFLLDESLNDGRCVVANFRKLKVVAAIHSSAFVLRVVGPSIAYIVATNTSVCLNQRFFLRSKNMDTIELGAKCEIMFTNKKVQQINVIDRSSKIWYE